MNIKMRFYLIEVLVFLQIIYASNAGLNDRLDCYLENDFKVNQKSCEERGCVWDSAKRSEGVPICYLDKKKIGYKRLNDMKKTSNGLIVDLELKVTAKFTFKQTEQIKDLKLEVIYLTDRILRFKVIDSKSNRYEVPFQKNFPLLQKPIQKVDEKQRYYSFDLSQSKDNFSFSVSRKSSKTKLFDTSIGGLIYSDQFLQIATHLPTKNVYGLGENTHHSLRHDFSQYKTFPLFTQDHATGDEQVNYYGVHPFYTCLESDGKSHGILLLNSNAMDYTTLPEPGLAFKTTGGVLDFFVFVGDNPDHVIELYTSLIGRPILPPFWGLGYQLTRWGFKTTDDIKKVIERNIRAEVPLDVMYMDIDYMDEYHDFSYSKKNFAKLPQLIDETKKKDNLRWTLILDPAIEAIEKDNPVFMDGYEKEVYVKWDKSVPKNERYNPPNVPSDKDVIYGKVWPRGPAAFPDFFKNVTQDWWHKWISNLHKDLKFDALWIDMNEPANQNDKTYKCPHNKYDYPSIRIKADYGNNNAKDLSHNTLCMVTVQGENSEYLHYNVHSLYGLSEMIATQKAIHSVTGKRGFAVSRSTYVSSGRYGTHWLGDNTSKWSHLRYSIIGILEFNMFGISFVGPDICGFLGNTTPELCKRWHQLGAFYPFSRNHNCIGNIDQDPAVWAEKGHPEVTQAVKSSFGLRYALLPYLYTLFYKAHTLGQTVARPVFHEFPTDPNTFEIDEQFMLGSALLVSPFLYENQTEVKAYLPNDVWYSVTPNITKVKKTGHVVIADNKQGFPPIHLRGGSIIPIHSNPKAINTETIRKGNVSVLVLPGTGKTALGDLFWDDGDSIDTIESFNYNYYFFNLGKNCSLDINVIENKYLSKQFLETIRIYGTNGDKVVATLDGKTIPSVNVDNKVIHLNVKLDLNSKKVGDKWTIKWVSNKTNSCNIE